MNNMILATINWSKVGLVLAIVAGLAFIFSILILIVTKICKVTEDKKVMEILNNLAGANCGGCGHSGCEGFAKALAEGKASINDCGVTDKEHKNVIAKVMGVEIKDEVPTIAVVKCNGGNNSTDKYSYYGNSNCSNQMIFMGGKKLCMYGCVGGGECQNVCPVGAITVKNGVAKVDKTLCISCGACINKCPKDIIENIPINAKVYIACNSHCRGKEVTTACANGCIACGICAKKCPEGAITMVDNLPVIDYNKCNGCLVCVEKCPRKCIHLL